MRSKQKYYDLSFFMVRKETKISSYLIFGKKLPKKNLVEVQYEKYKVGYSSIYKTVL